MTQEKTYAELVSQWPAVDREFLFKLIQLHNTTPSGSYEFDAFVLQNREKLNNPDYYQVFPERIELDEEYYAAHEEMCKMVYDFLVSNPDWTKLPFGLRTYMRLGIFQDTFKEYLDKKETIPRSGE